jgi:ADP-ribosylation factor family
MKRCKGESIDEVSPTLGFEIETLEYEGYSLHMWDIGGQKSIRSYWRNHFEQTDALIWVVDSADRHRLQVCADELASLLGEERLGGANLLVFANKQDIDGALSPAEIAEVGVCVSVSVCGACCSGCCVMCAAWLRIPFAVGVSIVVDPRYSCSVPFHSTSTGAPVGQGTETSLAYLRLFGKGQQRTGGRPQMGC